MLSRQTRLSIGVSAPPAGEGSAHSLAAVASAWRQVLGRTSFEQNFSFEQAGGDLLSMQQFAFCLERSCRLRMPLELFHLGLRPSDFVHALNQRLDLTPVHDRPVVFLLPGAYGFDSRLAHFSADCSPTLRIIGVPYPDWPEMVQPDVTFETIVAGAVAFMTERAPIGPLLIAGQSYGGHVAYAAALALSAAGRSVGFLGILDTPEVIRTPPLTLSARLVERARWGRVLQDLRRGYFRPMLRRILHESLFERPNIKRLLSHLAPLRRLRLRPLALNYHLQQHFNYVLRVQLLHRWRPPISEPTLPVRCFVFRAASNPPDAPYDLGWGRRCADVTVVPLAGDHVTIFDVPHRATLCGRFVEAVEQAAQQAVTPNIGQAAVQLNM
jgi:thioesterase domain-containing protein